MKIGIRPSIHPFKINYLWSFSEYIKVDKVNCFVYAKQESFTIKMICLHVYAVNSHRLTLSKIIDTQGRESEKEKKSYIFDGNMHEINNDQFVSFLEFFFWNHATVISLNPEITKKNTWQYACGDATVKQMHAMHIDTSHKRISIQIFWIHWNVEFVVFFLYRICIWQKFLYII